MNKVFFCKFTEPPIEVRLNFDAFLHIIKWFRLEQINRCECGQDQLKKKKKNEKKKIIIFAFGVHQGSGLKADY